MPGLKREVYWSVREKDKQQVLVAMQDRENEPAKTDVWIFDRTKVTQQFINELFQEWRDKNAKITFPYPHDHIVWDRSISTVFPEYRGIDRPAVVTVKEKKQEQKQLTTVKFDLLKKEIDLLEKADNTRFHPDHWEKAKQLSRRIKEAEEGDVSSQQARELQQLLQKIFDLMSSTKKSEELANFQQLSRQIQAVETSANNSTNWKSVRDELKQLQSDLKTVFLLGDEQRTQLSDRIQKAFQTVNTRQDAEREKYKQACDSNNASMSSDIDKARRLIGGSDWREASKQLRDLREQLKGMQLLKEQKDALFGKLNDASNELKQRQEKYDSDCESNYQRLLSRAQSVKSSASSSTDFKEVRESIKDLQSAVKDTDLKREHRDKLRDVLQGAFSAINANQDKEKERRQKEWEERKREQERRQQEWRDKMRERIDQLERTIREMEIGINKDYTTISDMERKRDNIRSGPKAYDIRQSMNEKISKARERISSKQEKVRNMERQLREIRDKLSR